MPRFSIKTRVNGTVGEVFAKFDKDLFLKLKPPFTQIEVIKFDGCETGDEVIISLKFVFIQMKWKSTITAHQHGESCETFTDEGKGDDLPPPLKSWEHQHKIYATESKTIIEDDIFYTTGSWLLDILIYQVLYLTFKLRSPIYQKVFREVS